MPEAWPIFFSEVTTLSRAPEAVIDTVEAEVDLSDNTLVILRG